MSYIDKNNIGGWAPSEPERNRKWPVGSLFASEGERLYDLVREVKPEKIIEVGTRYGCSTVHLATACKDNGVGVVHCYDTENIHFKWPDELKEFIEFHHMDYFEEPDKECDLLYEDGAHTTGFTSRVLRETKANVIAIHDFNHRHCIDTVQRESISILGSPDEVFQHEESDCGLGIWKNVSKKLHKKSKSKGKKCKSCG